jgi:CBS domain-containing protein
MARTVNEIMNRELLSLRLDEPVDRAQSYILALGITGAPIVDAEGRPLGVLSLRDCIGRPPGTTARQCMTSPASTVRDDAPIAEAAKTLVDARRHRLVVVGANGHAVGMVSAVDVVAALLGEPVVHPAAFPHHDRATGLTWTDDTPLEMSRVEVAPEGPGLLVLVRGAAGQPERIVWAEATHELRSRLVDLLSLPQTPALTAILELTGLRYRAASVPEGGERQRALAVIAEQENEQRRPRNMQP